MNLKTSLIICIALFGVGTGNAQVKNLPTYKEYIMNNVAMQQEIDVFLKENGAWAKYDSELGYTLGNSIPVEGIDTSATISTVTTNGARTMFMYKEKPCRINTYGDSFTQCQQVSDGETWQEYLAAHFGEPIRNYGVGGYGVYQAYRRLLREEKTKNAAENLVFYIWGDDPIRSLLRCRYMAIKDWTNRTEPGMRFHGNFWPNVEMDLKTGKFVEFENRLPTAKSLSKMTDPKWMYENLKDDLALQLLLFKMGKIADLDIKKLQVLSRWLKLDVNLTDKEKLAENASLLLDKYSFAATKYILEKLNAYAKTNKKKLLTILFDPYRTTNALITGQKRYDQDIVDYLKATNTNYFDMNLEHVKDYKKFNIGITDYYHIYFLGHYNPTGNHFFAFAIKNKMLEMLNPKPITYRTNTTNWTDFKGYLDGVK